MNMNYVQPITLRQMLTAIENAAIDQTIKGICIRPDGIGNISLSNIEELRMALEKFKESGKFIVAYNDS
jgi:protease-4